MIAGRNGRRLLAVAVICSVLTACPPSDLLTWVQEQENAKNITAFSIVSPPAVGTIVGTTIAVAVPFGTALSSLVASFKISGASLRVGAAVQVSGTTVNSFSAPLIYTVTAADSTTKNYTVTVTQSPQAFYFTGSQQPWTVPAGVTKIRVTATGAAGGVGSIDPPGAGGQMVADFNVVPGDLYYLSIGGRGGFGGTSWNGGGMDGHADPSTYAGGATDIRHGGLALTNRILVVGGGGGVGANGTSSGGYGAGTFNADGGPGVPGPEGLGGGGGTQVAGGFGGTGNFGLSPAPAGALGVGSSNTDYGGGGGGGYYGGGSGGSGLSGGHGGGGGGSSYLNLAYGTYVTGTNGLNFTSDGSVVFENISP